MVCGAPRVANVQQDIQFVTSERDALLPLALKRLAHQVEPGLAHLAHLRPREFDRFDFHA
jgi:hypothetical protein